MSGRRRKKTFNVSNSNIFFRLSGEKVVNKDWVAEFKRGHRSNGTNMAEGRTNEATSPEIVWKISTSIFVEEVTVQNIKLSNQLLSPTLRKRLDCQH